MARTRSTRRRIITVAALTGAALAVTACAGGSPDDGAEDSTADSGAANDEVTLTVATSQNEQTPNYYCGVEVLKDTLESADIGITVDLFPASQLGPDADRFPLVQAGDIDIDLQGASALSSTFEPIGVVDAAYAFDDVDHAFEWIDEGSDDLFTAFHDATGVRIVDGWFFGNRTFTTKGLEIRSPEDLDGAPIRFPNSPQFLANAQALGVNNPVSVAVEEVYSALQQGIAIGQENPIVATRSSSYDEVLDTIVLNDHNVGIHWLIVSDETYEKMNDEQAALLEQTLHEIRPDNRTCVEDATEEILDEYRGDDAYTVVEKDDIDMDAFIDQAEEFFRGYYSGDALTAYEAIRETAG